MVDRASILNNDRDNNVITLEINNKMLKITSMTLMAMNLQTMK